MTTFVISNPKDPDAVLDYAFDWSAWLASGETVDTVTVTADGVTKDSDTEAGGIVTVWVSGGTAGTNATLRCEVVTSAGRTDQRTMRIVIRDR